MRGVDVLLRCADKFWDQCVKDGPASLVVGRR